MTDRDRILTGTINEDGTVTPGRTLLNSWIRRCPHFIMLAEHYRQDGTCRCNDPDHPLMAEWGYVWDGSQWAAPPEDAA